ncbi:hypothetical protein [Caballeronia sp. KNU42]
MTECIAAGERWSKLSGAKKVNYFVTIKADQHFDFAASLYLAFDVKQVYEAPEVGIQSARLHILTALSPCTSTHRPAAGGASCDCLRLPAVIRLPPAIRMGPPQAWSAKLVNK